MSNIRQKNLAINVIETRGKSVSQSMKDVGYSDKTAHNPQQSTRSKGFQEEMAKQCPAKDLVKLQKIQLKSVKKEILSFDPDVTDDEIKKVVKEMGLKLIHIFRKEKEFSVGRGKNKHIETIKQNSTVYCAVPNFEFRDRALDKMYKINGVYSAERHIVNDFADMTDEELEEELKQAMAQKKRYDDAVPTKS